MDSMALKGVCTDMCPKKEKEMRKKNKRVHKLEKCVNISDEIIDKEDDRWMVKEYRRSAAGRDILFSDLRTSQTLLQTTFHLIKRVLPSQRHSLLDKYFFIFDRLRAVRQDASIQCHKDNNTILILLITIRFLIYASYKLSVEEDFDRTINNALLNECILTAINLLGGRCLTQHPVGAFHSGSESKHTVNVLESRNNFEGNEKEKENVKNKNRTLEKLAEDLNAVIIGEVSNGDEKHKSGEDTQSEGGVQQDMNDSEVLCEVLAYHVLNNLQGSHGVLEALSWKVRLKTLEHNLADVIKWWMSYHKHDYHRTLKLSSRFNLLQRCLLQQHVPHIQTCYLRRLAAAFTARNNYHNLPRLRAMLHLATPLDICHPPTTAGNPSNATSNQSNTTHSSVKPSDDSFLLAFQGVIVDGDKVIFNRKCFTPPYPLPLSCSPCLDHLLRCTHITSLLSPSYNS